MITLALGCGPPDRLDVEVSPHVPSSVGVTFDAPSARSAVVRVELDGEPARTVAATVQAGRATASVVGLRAGERYRLVGVADGVDRADARVRVDDAPDDLAFTVSAASDDAVVAGGWVLLAVTGPEWRGVVIVDPTGAPVWWVDAPEGWRAESPRPTRDGRGVLFLLSDDGFDVEDHRLVRVELDGTARREWVLDRAHHMAEELPDGTFAWLGWDVRSVPWSDGELERVTADDVLVGRGDGDATPLLSFFDDRGPPYVPCEHGLQLDPRGGERVHEWTHANSLVWLEERGTFVVVARLLDAMLELDAATGEVLWQAGGRDATLSWSDPDDAFSHGHLSEAWDGGALMFDNGGHLRDVSRVVEYAVDPAAGTARVVWQHEDPLGKLHGWLGDARRLPDDHVLVAWSTAPRVDEITRDGELLWRLEGPPDAIFGRLRFLPELR